MPHKDYRMGSGGQGNLKERSIIAEEPLSGTELWLLKHSHSVVRDDADRKGGESLKNKEKFNLKGW